MRWSEAVVDAPFLSQRPSDRGPQPRRR